MKRRSPAEMRCSVLSNTINGEYRYSRRGVPHVIFKAPSGIKYSACYFETSKSWRIFWPYDFMSDQNRITFSKDETDELVPYIRKIQRGIIRHKFETDKMEKSI